MHQFREAKGQNRRSLKGTYGSVIERILTSTKAKLTFLVSITLLTRLYAFLQTQVITYDGMLYVESAKLFSEGKYEEIPFLFNLYSFLLFLVHKLLGDWELSGQVVSVTLSILTVIPIFLLGRSLYNEKIGWLSSIFFIFLPDSLRYSSEVLRDPTSWFFMVLTLWLVWVGMQKNRFALFGAASLSAGLGSMNRAEGFVIWCALALFLAFQRTAGISIKNRGLNLAIFVLLFPLFLSPFLFLPRSNASQKALTKMPLYPTYFVKNYASVALQPQDHIVAIGDKVYKSLPIASKNFLELASRYRMILVASEVVYKFIKSSNLLILLIMLGLWKRKTEGFESPDGYLLCIWGALFGISYLYALQNNYFSTRHGLTLVIPCLFFAGHGLIFAVESLSRGMNRVAPQWTFLKKYLFHILTSILILIFAIQALSIGRTDKVGIKRIGL